MLRTGARPASPGAGLDQGDQSQIGKALCVGERAQLSPWCQQAILPEGVRMREFFRSPPCVMPVARVTCCAVSLRKGAAMERRASSKRFRLILIVSFLLAISLVGPGTSPARADYFQGGHGTPQFTYNPVSMNSTWEAHFSTAARYWNQAGSDHNVKISEASGSGSTVTATHSSESWYGYYQAFGTRHNRTFEIHVNTRTLSRDYGKSSNPRRSTATHEFGHGLSLADNPDTSRASLMKYNRNRNSMYKPQSYDIEEVRRMY